jgi:hypothetical protein
MAGLLADYVGKQMSVRTWYQVPVTLHLIMQIDSCFLKGIPVQSVPGTGITHYINTSFNTGINLKSEGSLII